MPHPEEADLKALPEALLRADVDLIVVGGAAAVLHGAPTTTHYLDIVHDLRADNVERFARLLTDLDAVVR
ncbi:MAG: hypothetical protein AB1486_14260 [Planctomycetota bacterium]